MIKSTAICNDFESVLDVAPPYESPGTTSYNAILNGAGVDCSGLFCAVFAHHGGKIYHGSNTIARSYMTTREKLTSTTQLTPGMAVLKWQASGEPSKFNSDGLGNFHHIGLCTSVNPLRIVHASSAKGRVTVDNSIKNWKYCGMLKGISYGTDKPDEGGDYMYVVKVIPTKLRVREEPNTSAKVLGTLTNGKTVKCSKLENGWYKLADAEGWISADYCKVIKQTEETETKEPQETEQQEENSIEKRVEKLEELYAGVISMIEELKAND